MIYKFRNYAFAAIGVVALGLAITLVNTKRAGAQQADAIVRPPNSKPASSVEVMNTPTVYLAGTPVATFDADNARQPFQAGNVFLAPNGSFMGTGVVAHVPAGKRLVIEHVDALGDVPGNQKVGILHLRTTVNGVTRPHCVVLHDQGVSFQGLYIQTAAQQVKLYADPDTDLTVGFDRNGNQNAGGVIMNISGYLVDIAQFQDMGR